MSKTLKYCHHYFCCIGGNSDITLGKVLAFFTGSEIIPPLGFNSVSLNYNDTDPFPTASTCALILTLPTKYWNNEYAKFKENFIYAIANHGGFGLM